MRFHYEYSKIIWKSLSTYLYLPHLFTLSNNCVQVLINAKVRAATDRYSPRSCYAALILLSLWYSFQAVSILFPRRFSDASRCAILLSCRWYPLLLLSAHWCPSRLLSADLLLRRCPRQQLMHHGQLQSDLSKSC